MIDGHDTEKINAIEAYIKANENVEDVRFVDGYWEALGIDFDGRRKWACFGTTKQLAEMMTASGAWITAK